MAIYYINGSNTVPKYPYTTPETGAHNFYLLLKSSDKIILVDDDVIILYNPIKDNVSDAAYYNITDSSYSIEIYVRVYIRTMWEENIYPTIETYAGGGGIIISGDYSNGTVLKNLKFSQRSDDVIIISNTSNVLIEGCNFIWEYTDNNGRSVVVNNSDFVTIKNNNIKLLYSDSVQDSKAITLISSNKCNIINNNIDVYNGAGIIISDYNGEDNKIKENLTYNSNLTNLGGVKYIHSSGSVENLEVEYNVMSFATSAVTAIDVNTSNSNNNVKIKNNIIIVGDNDNNTIGVKCEAQGSNSNYEITNNIFFSYIDNIPSTIPISAVNIDNLLIDYNNYYCNFSHLTSPFNLSAQTGDRNINSDPKILTFYDSSLYPTSAFESYYCSANSNSLGVGQYYENIGINDIEEFTSFVDTVTHKIGEIKGTEYINNHLTTFLNSVFTEDINIINTTYFKTYTSGDGFNNQFSWNSNVDNNFPFISGNDLYDKELNYVIQNKSNLQPFDNILCPANPGYGTSAYIDYETGLYGFSRYTYENQCLGSDECTIQDDYVIDIIWDDTTSAGIIVIDEINPLCISAS